MLTAQNVIRALLSSPSLSPAAATQQCALDSIGLCCALEAGQLQSMSLSSSFSIQPVGFLPSQQFSLPFIPRVEQNSVIPLRRL